MIPVARAAMTLCGVVRTRGDFSRNRDCPLRRAKVRGDGCAASRFIRDYMRSRIDPCDMHRKKIAVCLALCNTAEAADRRNAPLHHSFTPGIE